MTGSLLPLACHCRYAGINHFLKFNQPPVRLLCFTGTAKLLLAAHWCLPHAALPHHLPRLLNQPKARAHCSPCRVSGPADQRYV